MLDYIEKRTKVKLLLVLVLLALWPVFLLGCYLHSVGLWRTLLSELARSSLIPFLLMAWSLLSPPMRDLEAIGVIRRRLARRRRALLPKPRVIAFSMEDEVRDEWWQE